ncbi:MAG: RIP metalloprotease RseP [Desulfuromonadaceae bacterium]|nr:RIP metalloprotease RseP [Desulfuromonadaceae bacterium]
MTTVAAGILMLGVLVFVHELGHFCIAKLAGVKVLKFSLGFGPRLIGRRWGETEYLISLIPLGGYVQMLGEGAAAEGEVDQLTPQERQRAFSLKPVSQRMAIVAAGPVMNLLLPLLLLPAAYMIGVQVPAFLDEAPCVGYVLPGSDSARSGFLAGDCIRSVNGVPVQSWTETDKALIPEVGSALRFGIQRQQTDLILEMTAKNNSLEGLQSLGLLPPQEAVIGRLTPGFPAEKAGLRSDDHIVQIGDQVILSWYQLHDVIQNLQGETAAFIIERQGQRVSLPIDPHYDEQRAMWLVGITPQQRYKQEQLSFSSAVQAGFKRTAELIDLTVVFIRKLLAGHVSSDNIGGPIMVMQIAGQAAQTDFSTILTVLAFLSIQLGVLNLLPIPVLDGGHLLFNFVELIWRRPLSLRAREVAQQIGLGLLLLLMMVAFYNDLVRLFFQGS